MNVVRFSLNLEVVLILTTSNLRLEEMCISCIQCIRKFLMYKKCIKIKFLSTSFMELTCKTVALTQQIAAEKLQENKHPRQEGKG